jgi:serine/threonine protein kinase
MQLAATTPRHPRRLAALTPGYEPGTLIVGKYRLESQLGDGGMGTVWLARNETLDAPVALKLMRSGVQSQESAERLLLEARVEATLRHPNIVRAFDFGQTDLGDPFIVMEVLDGISFGDLLEQRGRLGATEAIQLVLPVIGALCHAHENGVVHRDLKPHNIFLDRVGTHTAPKLLDFGIAKLMGDAPHHFTLGGTLVGSPPYMAPEQARGLDDVDHRADIWAICVVLYEAISGTPAFPGEEGHVVLRSVVDDEVPALMDTGAGETALWRILSRGLEKDPSRRFQSMRELGTALAQWLCDQGETEDLDGNRISRSWVIAPMVHEAKASSSDQSEAISLPFSARPRRNLQRSELPPGVADSFARALRAGMSQRAASALRIAAASVFAIAVVLALSKTMSTGPMQRAPVAQVRSTELTPSPARAALAEAEPPVLEALLPRAVAVPLKSEAREVSYPRRAHRRLTETELGLKVAY